MVHTGRSLELRSPSSIGELIARTNAFLRRKKLNGAATCKFGEFELNFTTHRLFRNGQEVVMTAKEFQLLAFLSRHPGCALTRSAILDSVWGNFVAVTERSVDRCVKTLRAKIEPKPHRPVYIQTIRDVGYRFEPGQEE